MRSVLSSALSFLAVWCCVFACRQAKAPEAGVAEAGAPAVEVTAGPSPEAPAADRGPGPDPREELTQRTYDVVLDGTTIYRATTAGIAIEEGIDPSNPVRLGVLHLAGSVNDLEWLGRIKVDPPPATYIAAALGPAGVAVADVTDPTGPVEAARVDTDGAAMGLAWSAPFLYVADGAAGVVAIDLSNPAAPRRIAAWEGDPLVTGLPLNSTGALPPPPYVRSVTLEASGIPIVYAAAGPVGVVALDVADFRFHRRGNGAMRAVWAVNTPGDARASTSAGDILLVADGPAGLQVIGPRTAGGIGPSIAGTYATLDMCRGVAASGTTAYLAVGDRGLEIVDVSDPASPRRLGGFVPKRPVNRVTVGSGGLLHLANDGAGLTIVDASDPAAVRHVFTTPESR